MDDLGISFSNLYGISLCVGLVTRFRGILSSVKSIVAFFFFQFLVDLFVQIKISFISFIVFILQLMHFVTVC